MKNNKITQIVLIITLIITLSACNDDITDVKNLVNGNGLNINLHNSNDTISQTNAPWLDFNSIVDYENTINLLNQNENYLTDFETDLQFNSMRLAMSEYDREEIGIEDDILATLLNPEGIVQIGRYIFKVDVLRNLVIAYDELDLKDTLHFGIDDNAIDILYGTPTLETLNMRRSNYKAYYDFNAETTIYCKTVYQRAAIYFSLLVKINKEYAIRAIEITYNMYAGTYTKNRNNAPRVNFNAHNNGGIKKSYSYRPYASIVGLKQFYLSSGFYYTNWNNLEQGNVILTIQK